MSSGKGAESMETKTFVMRGWTVMVVAICLIVAGTQAAVGTVNLQGRGYYNETAVLYGGGLNGVEAWSGVYTWTVVGWTGLGKDVPGWGFCLELAQEGKNGWHDLLELQDAPLPSQYGTPMGMVKADYIRELWGRYFDPAWPTGADTQKAEAFSAAIWEIVYETESIWDVTSGTGFKATGVEQAALANSWLASLNGQGPKATNLYAVSRDDGQDYVVQIPEPMTILILALGSIWVRRVS